MNRNAFSFYRGGGRSIIRSGLTGTLFLAVAFALSAGGQNEEATISSNGAPRSGRVEYVEGAVSIDGESAEFGDILASGAVITTGSDGVLEVVFGSGNALLIESDTRLVVDLNDPRSGIELERGSFAAVFEGLETVGVGGETTFRLGTPSTVAGVRGTAFFIKVETAGSTYVCTCHGILDFDDGALTVRAARHAARRFTKTDEGVTVEEAEEVYHDTDALNAVADIVGVTIAWGEEP